MAKKNTIKNEKKENRFFSVMWRLLLIAAIAALVYWQWWTITSWTERTARNIWNTFGLGLLMLAAAPGILVWAAWQRRLLVFIRFWNKWLGVIVFAVVVWGLLGAFRLGGSIGLGIIDYISLGGILRVTGLGVIGIILLAPRPSFRVSAKSMKWLAKRFQRSPSPPKPSKKQKSVPVPSAEVSQPQEATAKAETASEKPTDLRQVAQEVWKKYGEAPGLVTVNGWRLPPIDILDETPEVEFSQADNVRRGKLIEEALASYGVDAKVVQINVGPTVTQFGIEPGWDRKYKEIKEKDKDGNVRVRLDETSKTRIKVERITSLANDLALALAAPTIRIEAPVPGKSVVGIEVPNTIASMVSLRGVIETSAFQKLVTKSKMGIALGKGAGGEAIAGDLVKMPHLLIAGATGSGKTVCLNAIISCLLMHNSPNEARFIMIDPKRVELTPYNSIPHLATPVVVDTNKALDALRWLNQEMDRRYQHMAGASARNIESYNKNKQGDELMPYLVLVIDELADLMMTSSEEVEHILCRLAQLARATGIHLVVATQRPSVDVVTGLIKANFPTRISFAVTSQVDSRTILDGAGAEKLLGRGDMLYMPTEAGKPKRLQGCFVSDPEVERLVYFWGSQQRREETFKLSELIPTLSTATTRDGTPKDALLDSARQLAREHKHISTSFLQRRLRIGYPRAARIMEQLEEEGFRGTEDEKDIDDEG